MYYSTRFVTIILLHLHYHVTSSTSIQLCCPLGQVYTQSRPGQGERCQAQNTMQSSCQDYEGFQPDWNEGQNFKYVGNGFRCSDGASLVPAEELFGPHEVNLTAAGRLNLQVKQYDSNQSKLLSYENSDFCLMLTDIPDYYDYQEEGSGEDDGGNTIRQVYSVCYKDQNSEEIKEERVFTGIFYPAAIFISDFFIFITLGAYLFIKDMRKNFFGKMTMGFLFNVLICYTFLGVQYSLDLVFDKELLETLPCKVIGYIIQHTFIAFFFWISAMAFNITSALTSVFVVKKSQNQCRSLLLNICFAQGCPLLISLVTAALDLYGPCDYILPNMGKYTCFIGSQYDPVKRFFETPEFLYFYLIIAIIILLNIIFFIITAASLIKHWSQTKDLNSSHKDGTKKHLRIVFKLFIIMGIPWTCELASAAVGHAYEEEKSFAVRLALDIMNLLTGVLIFCVLVCRHKVLEGVKKQLVSKADFSYTSSRRQSDCRVIMG